MSSSRKSCANGLRNDSLRHRFRARLYTGALFLLIPGIAYSQQVQSTVDKAPMRANATHNTTCPPINANAADVASAKLPTDHPKDMDVNNGDGDNDPTTGKDYFMGEWKYVKGNENLIVRKWCISNPVTPDDPATPNVDESAFNDFFSVQVFTSLNTVETERIMPRAPT